MGRHLQGHFLLNDVQTELPKTVAKSTACLSYVNDPEAFAARNTKDQLAGDARNARARNGDARFFGFGNDGEQRLVFTMDIKSLYTVIPNDEGLV